MIVKTLGSFHKLLVSKLIVMMLALKLHQSIILAYSVSLQLF